MKRLLRIGWAKAKCHFYLLYVGMWRGECEMVTYHTVGRRAISGIFTVRPADYARVRTFYAESPRRPIV